MMNTLRKLLCFFELHEWAAAGKQRQCQRKDCRVVEWLHGEEVPYRHWCRKRPK